MTYLLNGLYMSIRIYFQFKFVKNVFDLYCVDELCETLSSNLIHVMLLCIML